jgi:DNA-binding response OmpR family regulator
MTPPAHRFEPVGRLNALVVDPVAPDRMFVASTMSSAGFLVTVTDSFAAAKERMTAKPPALLITEVCLAEYNGLHLVIRGLAADARMGALVTCSHEDVVLRKSAEELGATFVVKPITGRELVAAVFRTLFRGEHEKGPVRAPFERRSSDRRSVLSAMTSDRRASDRRRSPGPDVTLVN